MTETCAKWPIAPHESQQGSRKVPASPSRKRPRKVASDGHAPIRLSAGSYFARHIVSRRDRRLLPWKVVQCIVDKHTQQRTTHQRYLETSVRAAVHEKLVRNRILGIVEKTQLSIIIFLLFFNAFLLFLLRFFLLRLFVFVVFILRLLL